MTAIETLDLQRAAKEHLWMHFTRMGEYDLADVPIIVRGDGCYLEDSNGKRYLDALAGLFSVNIGYSFGEEIGQAALEQMRELPFYTNWSYAHPRAIELAEEVASLAPGDLNRVFFCSGGSEAVESAWKLARQYYIARGEKQFRGLVTPGARAGAQDGETETMHDAIVVAATRRRDATRPSPDTSPTTGRRSARCRSTASRPSVPPSSRSSQKCGTSRTRTATTARPRRARLSSRSSSSTSSSRRSWPWGRTRSASCTWSPCRTPAAASHHPPGTGAACARSATATTSCSRPTRSSPRSGDSATGSRSERYDIRPDIVTSAKGLSSSYASIGAVIATDKVMEPFMGATSMFSHGITFGGHPVMCAIALKNIEIMKREGIIEHVRANEDAFRSTLAQLLDIPIVGDLRGTGFFYAIELVKDRDTRETFSDEECEKLLRGFLSNALFDAGMICRADDRGDPVIQISPPLVAGQAEFDEITSILGDVLTRGSALMRA